MNEPPWEWINGDPVYAARYGFVRGVLVGSVGALGAVILVSVFTYLEGSPTAVVASPAWGPMLLTPAMLAFEGALLLFLAWYQAHRPVVARLGLSPIGVRIELPVTPAMSGRIVSWWGVAVLGPETVRLDIGWPWTTIRLTPGQMRRLTSFWNASAAHPR